MKKLFVTMMLLIAATTMNAQTIVKGDMNDDKELTITDAVSVVDVILGRSPKQEISLVGDPYVVDNTLVVGTWYAPDGTSFAMNEDGTTTFPSAVTYKFRPYQGTLMFFNSSGNPVKTIVLNEVEKGNYLLAINYITETYTYYRSMHSPDDYVDLGLPSGTLWATCNIGASKPEEYGDYFAWGETKGYNGGYTDFNWSIYFDTNNGGLTFKKYNNNGGLAELEYEDDAAYVNWGPAWRMPTQDQFQELINNSNTTTEWTTLNGVYGRKITSKSNHNFVFLPAAGYRYGNALGDTGSRGHYWSCSLYKTEPKYAWDLIFLTGGFYMDSHFRLSGYSVRPVRRLE